MPDHTHGPWTYNEESGELRGLNDFWIARLANFREFSDIQLILAAPDLLNACQHIHDWITMNLDEPINVGSEIELKLRNAIAKAVPKF